MNWDGSGGRKASFYWYDLETTGTQPKWDRIVQFAAIRTDENLEEVGEQSSFYIKLPMDVLPDPGACLVTGLTPQSINAQALDEMQGIDQINNAFSVPQTCVVGYNSLRFDDEFIRYTFYRNFLDPYAREWQNRNSRWDLIDLVRATAVLRPQGINWPKVEDANTGETVTSFRLEELSLANELEHSSAHEALSDVRATIQLARLVKQNQPKLFEYYLSLRNKRTVLEKLQPFGEKVYMHVSGMYSRTRHSIAPVMSICAGGDANAVVVLDLNSDYAMLESATVEELRTLLFTRHEGARPGLKEIKVNRCPFIAPASVMREEDQERLEIDMIAAEQLRQHIQNQPDLKEKIAQIYKDRKFAPESDVEAQLYEGGFLNNQDKANCHRVWEIVQAETTQKSGIDAALANIHFSDKRMAKLLVHMRARRDFDVLDEDDRAYWLEYVQGRLGAESGVDSTELGALSLKRYLAQIDQWSGDEHGELKASLLTHGQGVSRWLEDLGS